VKEDNFGNYLGMGFVCLAIAIMLVFWVSYPDDIPIKSLIVLYAIEAFFFFAGLLFIFKAGQLIGRGKSKTHLPNGKYRRLTHYFSDDHVFFYLIREGKDKKENKTQPFSWRGEKAVILGRNGRPLKHYPEIFQSKQGQIKYLGQEYKKNPRMKNVYYFFPAIEEEER